jgi:hypothetical protein
MEEARKRAKNQAAEEANAAAAKKAFLEADARAAAEREAYYTEIQEREREKRRESEREQEEQERQQKMLGQTLNKIKARDIPTRMKDIDAAFSKIEENYLVWKDAITRLTPWLNFSSKGRFKDYEAEFRRFAEINYKARQAYNVLKSLKVNTANNIIKHKDEIYEFMHAHGVLTGPATELPSRYSNLKERINGWLASEKRTKNAAEAKRKHQEEATKLLAELNRQRKEMEEARLKAYEFGYEMRFAAKMKRKSRANVKTRGALLQWASRAKARVKNAQKARENAQKAYEKAEEKAVEAARKARENYQAALNTGGFHTMMSKVLKQAGLGQVVVNKQLNVKNATAKARAREKQILNEAAFYKAYNEARRKERMNPAKAKANAAANAKARENAAKAATKIKAAFKGFKVRKNLAAAKTAQRRAELEKRVVRVEAAANAKAKANENARKAAANAARQREAKAAANAARQREAKAAANAKAKANEAAREKRIQVALEKLKAERQQPTMTGVSGALPRGAQVLKSPVRYLTSRTR